jgi:hypothetical protein
LLLSEFRTLVAAIAERVCQGESGVFHSGNKVVIRLITPLRMSYEESYPKAFPFVKMVPGMLAPEMIEETAKIVNEAVKDKVQVNLIINNRTGSSAP